MKQTNTIETGSSWAKQNATEIHPYHAELFLYEPWEPKNFFQFEITINFLVSSF